VYKIEFESRQMLYYILSSDQNNQKTGMARKPDRSEWQERLDMIAKQTYYREIYTSLSEYYFCRTNTFGVTWIYPPLVLALLEHHGLCLNLPFNTAK
jgi:hypothetical protein